MTAESKRFQPGELVLLSSGEYSDYAHSLFGRVIVEFDADEALALFKTQDRGGAWSEDERLGAMVTYRFAKWLVVDAGLVEEVPVRELWLNSSLSEEIRGCDVGEVERLPTTSR